MPVTRWPGREVPFSAEVKDEWSSTSAPRYMPSWRGQGIIYLGSLPDLGIKTLSVAHIVYD